MNSFPSSCANDILVSLNRNGFAIVRKALTSAVVDELRSLCATALDDPAVSRRGDCVYGIRNLLTVIPYLRTIASESPYIDWAIAVMGESARPVYGVYFDKIPGANWPVTWHQDVTIRVRERIDVPGFDARVVKDGMVHMLPPVEISEQVLSLRIHLDDASLTHGALRVIPGSHRLGRLSNEQLHERHTTSDPVYCEVDVGDIMLMRPLLMHSSSACERPGHRRVVHIDYSAVELPGGLEWSG